MWEPYSGITRCSIPLGHRVISRSGLNLVVLVVGVDFDFAERAVEFGVGRAIADVVLAAQFGGDLIEAFFELVELVSDFDHPAAGFLSEFVHLPCAEALPHAA